MMEEKLMRVVEQANIAWHWDWINHVEMNTGCISSLMLGDDLKN
jgi:hypothetical protein